MGRLFKNLATLVVVISMSMLMLLSASAQAANSGITYQGRILKPDSTPVSGANVQFRIQLRTPGTNNCLMYEEIQAQDLSASRGNFSLTINDGSGTRTDSSGFGLDRAFANRGTFTFDPSTCSVGSTYTPNEADGRVLAVYFKDETMSAWEPMPAQNINYVPFAFESKQIAGFKINNLMRVEEADGTLTSISPLSNANYDALKLLVAGTSGLYEKAGRLGGSVISGTPAAGQVLSYNGTAWTAVDPIAGVQAFAKAALPTCGAGQFLKDNGAGLLTCATPSGSATGTVTSVATGAGLTGGPITTTGTIALASLGVGGTGFKVTYDTYGRVTAAVALVEADIPTITTAGKVSGSAITSGAIGGSTSINTVGSINTAGALTSGSFSTGNITATSITAPSGSFTTVAAKNVEVYETANQYKVTLKVPTGANPGYDLTLPATAGASGKILGTTGAGVLAWVDPSSASQWTTSGNSIYYNVAGGFVGIGNTLPGFKLDVTGDINTSTQYNYLGVSILRQPNSSSLAVGNGSMPAVTGTRNTAVGVSAMNGTTTGTNNVAVGFGAMQSNTGNYNIAIGSALTGGSGSYNIAMGENAIQSLSGAQSKNIAMGYFAGRYLTTGQQNLMIGHNVGQALTTGDGNILLGASTNVPSATTSDFVNIGNGIFGTGFTGSTSSPAGKVGIGTTTPLQKLDVAGAIRIGTTTTCDGTLTGTIRYNGGNLEFCNGAWQTLGVSGAGITTLAGDVTSTGAPTATTTIAAGAVTTAKIADEAVTTAKIAPFSIDSSRVGGNALSFDRLQRINSGRLVGRGQAGLGTIEEIQLGTNLALTAGGVLNASFTDSFAALPCADGYVPYKASGSWTCALATAAGTVDAIVKRDTAGSFVSAGATFTNSVKLKDGTAGGEVTLAAPTGFTSYGLTLPTTAGTSGYVLSTNGSGTLSWLNPATAAGASQWTTSGSNIYYNASGGNVGIGTASPTKRFEINDNSSTSVALLQNTNSNGYSSTVFADSAGTIQGGVGWGNSLANSAYANKLYLGTSTSSPIALVTNGTERMRVEPGGNVGIGTTAPSFNLSLGGASTARTIGLEPGATYSGSDLSIQSGSVATGAIDADAGNLILKTGSASGSNAANSEIQFWTSTGGSSGATLRAPTQKMVIRQNGNVGIGTAAPTQKLDIVGSFRVGSAASGGKAYRFRTDGGALDLEASNSDLLFSNYSAANFTGTQYNYLALKNSSQDAMAYGTWTWYSGNSYNAGTAQVSIKANGTVGIGTGTGALGAGEKLNVTGGAIVAGAQGTAANSGGEIRLKELAAGGSNYVGFRSPDGLSADTIWTLPTGLGTNGQVLTTDAAGVLSWTSPAGSSPWTVTGSDVYRASGNVGIGTAAPISKLQVAGNNYALESTPANYAAIISNYDGATDMNGLFVKAGFSGNPNSVIAAFGAYAGPGNVSSVLTVRASGNVGIGTTSPTEMLTVNGNALAVAYLYSSDRRLKKDITPIESALAKVLRLNGVSYRWIKPLNEEANREQLGVIAQDVEAVFPQAVTVSSDGTKRVNYPKLVAPLIEAVKDLDQTNKKQDRSLASLEERAERAEAEVVQLKAQNAAFEARLRALEKSLRPAK
ncbi:MAG: tail fiber domain-containing protein [Proteobacteria bacterium]|nr:MAG: tail fiber domain-containing protein [Pseudomonadota bacterium]